jgi:hypothetical protein
LQRLAALQILDNQLRPCRRTQGFRATARSGTWVSQPRSMSSPSRCTGRLTPRLGLPALRTGIRTSLSLASPKYGHQPDFAWVNQHGISGLGANVPIATGNQADSLQSSCSWVAKPSNCGRLIDGVLNERFAALRRRRSATSRWAVFCASTENSA